MLACPFFTWLPPDLIDESGEAGHLPESCLSEGNVAVRFIVDSVVSNTVYNPKEDRPADKQRGVAGKGNKIYIHPPGNEPFNCVSRLSFSKPRSQRRHAIC